MQWKLLCMTTLGPGPFGYHNRMVIITDAVTTCRRATQAVQCNDASAFTKPKPRSMLAGNTHETSNTMTERQSATTVDLVGRNFEKDETTSL